MKKIISFVSLLTFLAVGISNTTTAYAATLSPAIETSTIIKDSDGGYYLETITETLSNYPLTYGIYSTNTKTKTKTTKYYNTNNTLCWQYSLTGSFRINKESATCTSSNAKLSIYDTNYSLYSENHSHSGNKATGTVKIKHGENVKSRTISIICSKNGDLS